MPSAEPFPSRDRATAVIRRLLDRGDLERVPELQLVYVVSSPYAQLIPLSDEQLVQEANPRCFFSHLTALIHHDLTGIVPNRIYAATASRDSQRIPLDTTADDWIDVPIPSGQRPAVLNRIPIVWTRGRDEAGVEVAHRQGGSVYVTNLERTLLDALRDPDKAHGINTVLQAWRLGSERWDLPRLLRYADEGPVMRQRVGYLVERMGQRSPVLDDWKTRLQRGGSLKLLGSEPYASTFSGTWNLSLNVPESVLGVLDD